MVNLNSLLYKDENARALRGGEVVELPCGGIMGLPPRAKINPNEVMGHYLGRYRHFDCYIKTKGDLLETGPESGHIIKIISKAYDRVINSALFRLRANNLMFFNVNKPSRAIAEMLAVMGNAHYEELLKQLKKKEEKNGE